MKADENVSHDLTAASRLARVGEQIGGPVSLGPGRRALDQGTLTSTSGIAPRGGNAFVGLIRTLQQNWTWLVSTGLGLVLVLIAGLMVAGRPQAADWLFRVVGGTLVIPGRIPPGTG